MHIHTNTFDKSGFAPMKLSVLQRILLTTDGRVTDIIQAYSNESIYAVKLSQEVETLVEPIPVLEITNKHQILRRKVLLRGKKSQTNFLYADSLLVSDRFDKKIKDDLILSDKPIGKLILDYKIETYREILNWGIEQAESIAEYFQIDTQATVINRTYRIFAYHSPIMLITEKFPASYFRY